MSALQEMKKTAAAKEQNAFAGQKKCPTEAALASSLGSTLPLWNQLIADLKQELNVDSAEWHSGSLKHGWSIRLQVKKRNIVYLGPRLGRFVAAFALGDKAIAAARKRDLPADLLRIINESKRYAEGTAVRIEVKTAHDLETVKVLAKIKIEN